MLVFVVLVAVFVAFVFVACWFLLLANWVSCLPSPRIFLLFCLSAVLQPLVCIVAYTAHEVFRLPFDHRCWFFA